MAAGGRDDSIRPASRARGRPWRRDAGVLGLRAGPRAAGQLVRRRVARVLAAGLPWVAGARTGVAVAVDRPGPQRPRLGAARVVAGVRDRLRAGGMAGDARGRSTP